VDIRQGIYDCKGCAIIWRSWRSRAFMNTGVDVDGAHVGLIFLVLPSDFLALRVTEMIIAEWCGVFHCFFQCRPAS